MYKLSNTSKMPGKSWSLPASRCQMGSALAKVKGSVCSKCYARKGSYCYPSVENVRQVNYAHYIENPSNFYEELKTLIETEYLKTRVAYFRWFDSGDLVSTDMLESIIKLAIDLPYIQFWLPTKEYNMVKSVTDNLLLLNKQLPVNIAIRLSVFMIDGDYFKFDPSMKDILQSRVISLETTPYEDEIVCYGNCVSCNYSCWDATQSIAYPQH